MADFQSKTIWIINQYASTPETGMGGRHYYLAKELAKQGHKVYLIASGYTHLLREPPKLEHDFTVQQIDENFHFVWIKLPKYCDAHAKKRVLNWFKFAWKLLNLPKVIEYKPDSILVSSPAPFMFLGAQCLSKKFNAKLAFEVRDIWPLTLIELGGFSKNHPFIKLMQWVEDKAYRDSDVVLSNLPNSVDHMVDRGMIQEKFVWLPNGFDKDEFENARPLDKVLKAKLSDKKFIVGYAGTFGVANALNIFIKAAELLQNESDIEFVLVGGGKVKKKLVDQARTFKNVVFLDPIPKQQIQSMLSNFDTCYIGWRNESMYRFGIAPRKIPEYMFSKKPIIHSYSGSFDYVKIAQAGLSIPAENPKAIADAILQLKSMSMQERQKMGANGRAYVLLNHDYAKLAIKLANVLL